METLPAVTEDRAGLEALTPMVTAACLSRHTRRAYALHIRKFLRWCEETGRPFSRQTVNEYRSECLEDTSGGTIALGAIKKLAVEAAQARLMDWDTMTAILHAPSVKRRGRRCGNWLKLLDAQRLLDAPDTSTLAGLRDRALLALLMGAALRRDEAARVRVEHIQQRENRWCIVDLRTKAHRTHTVALPAWAKPMLDAWLGAAGITEGHVLRPVNKGGHIQGDRMSARGVYDVVRRYSAALKLTVAPHDLRRTVARLAKRGGADMGKVQHLLGHASSAVTDKYLGDEVDLEDAAVDYTGLEG